MNESTFFLAMAILLTFFGVIFATAGIAEAIRAKKACRYKTVRKGGKIA